VIPLRLNFICRRFGKLCSIFRSGVSRKNNRDVIVGVFIRLTVWLENSLTQSEGEVTGKGRVRVEKQVVEGKDPQVEASSTYVREKRYCFRARKGSYGMVEIKLLFQMALSFLSACTYRRGVQDLLKIRPSSLFMLCGCISSSMASLMSRSMYPVLTERSFVSCSLIIRSWLMLCSATADLPVCASRICNCILRF